MPVSESVQLIGLATTDESLVDRVGVVVSRGGAKLSVASDDEAARRLFMDEHCELRLFDLRSIELLPQPGCASCPVLAPPYRDAILVMQQGGNDACLARRSVSMYSCDHLDRLLVDLARVLPKSGAVRARDAADSILGQTPAIHLVREQIRSVARYADVSVLILGETGTGKELVAEAIHELSVGDRETFVAINCAAIPENLVESELFGHEAGAYTGARGVRIGLLESAGAGTVFLDEVGEMPPTLQPKLLRVLESRKFRRVGGNRDIALRARIVSATNRGLSGKSSGLRSDLQYRLSGFTVVLPPLRERVPDIDELAQAFLRAFGARHGVGNLAFTDEARAALRAHPWPGNVRELRAAVEHAAILSSHSTIGTDEIRAVLDRQPRSRSTLPPSQRIPSMFPVEPPTARLRDVERTMIQRAFEENAQNLSKTARQLGIPRSTLRDKLRRYGVAF